MLRKTIKIGPLGIRFLLTGDDSNGNVSVFEVLVPVGQKLAAPAHKNDAYEGSSTASRASLSGRLTACRSRLVPGRRCASRESRRSSHVRPCRFRPFGLVRQCQQITYQADTSRNEWKGGLPILIKALGRNVFPILAPDGGMLAIREERGGISLYHTDGGQPVVVKGVLHSEYIPSALPTVGSHCL
jgi:hypothetical protein